jgi:hypothetical protein
MTGRSDHEDAVDPLPVVVEDVLLPCGITVDRTPGAAVAEDFVHDAGLYVSTTVVFDPGHFLQHLPHQSRRRSSCASTATPPERRLPGSAKRQLPL